jgi:hypothetical protein
MTFCDNLTHRALKMTRGGNQINKNNKYCCYYYTVFVLLKLEMSRIN